jgi:hypothetical protein
MAERTASKVRSCGCSAPEKGGATQPLGVVGPNARADDADRVSDATALTLGVSGRVARSLAAAVLMAAVVGCGGGDDGTARQAAKGDFSGGGSAGRAASSVTPTPAQERVIARRAQLRLGDFPANWQESENPDNERSDCEGIRGPREATIGRATSPKFHQGTTTIAESGVFLYADAAEARDAFGTLSASDTRRCLAEEVADTAADKTQRTAGLTIGEPSTYRLRAEPLGDQRAAGRATLPMSASGLDVELTVDFVFVRVGRGVALLALADVQSPFDEELRADLTSTVARRLAAELS